MKNQECVVSALVMNLTLESQWIKGFILITAPCKLGALLAAVCGVQGALVFWVG